MYKESIKDLIYHINVVNYKEIHSLLQTLYSVLSLIEKTENRNNEK
jgi:hypothetical protein